MPDKVWKITAQHMNSSARCAAVFSGATAHEAETKAMRELAELDWYVIGSAEYVGLALRPRKAA